MQEEYSHQCVPKHYVRLPYCDPQCIMGTCVLNETLGLNNNYGYCKCDPFFTGDSCNFYACHTFCYNKGKCDLKPGPTPESDSIPIVSYF